MIKLVVGVDDLDHFLEIQQNSIVEFEGQPANAVRTRFKPKRADDVLNGGSLYRVIKNKIVCRQKIIGFSSWESPDKGTQTLIMVEPEIIQTYSTPKRPFQGWRYLEPAAAPKDRGIYLGDNQREDIPEDLEESLKEAGLL
jgi:hypothetical protein